MNLLKNMITMFSIQSTLVHCEKGVIILFCQTSTRITIFLSRYELILIVHFPPYPLPTLENAILVGDAMRVGWFPYTVNWKTFQQIYFILSIRFYQRCHITIKTCRTCLDHVKLKLTCLRNMTVILSIIRLLQKHHVLLVRALLDLLCSIFQSLKHWSDMNHCKCSETSRLFCCFILSNFIELS